jgi:hypothetical protein
MTRHQKYQQTTGTETDVIGKYGRVEPGYNDIGLHDTSSIASDILWHQLIPHR